MSLHFHKLSIKDVRRETPDCISVAFDIPGDLKEVFRYKAGQNITIRYLLNNEDLRRSYSICTGVHENELRIAIKATGGGRFSSWANSNLAKGQTLEVLAPTGSFVTKADPGNRKRYLAIAAGSGITPISSIIRTVLNDEPLSSFTLIYGNRNRASIIFREQLDALKNQYMHRLSIHHLLTRELPEAEIYSGRINAAKCAELGKKLIDYQTMDEIFLCGPAEMIFELKDWFLHQGIRQEKIHFELFNVPVSTLIQPGNNMPPESLPITVSMPSPEKSFVSHITIKQDGLSLDFDLSFDSESILEAALDQGADLPFSCKGGVCSTCRAKLVEGEVEMEVNYALEPEEVAAGYILVCQSRPTTNRVVIDFDIR